MVQLGVNRPGLEADTLLPSRAEYNIRSFTYIHPHIFMSWCVLTKHIDFPLSLG